MTTIQKLIEDLIEIDRRGISITNKGFIQILESSLPKEREMVMESFNEGVKYGNEPLQTFDYPASRYYEFINKNQ